MRAHCGKYGKVFDVEKLFDDIFRDLKRDLDEIRQVSTAHQMLTTVWNINMPLAQRKKNVETFNIRLKGVAMAVEAFAASLGQILSCTAEDENLGRWQAILWGSIAGLLQVNLALGYCVDQTLYLIELLTISTNLLRFRSSSQCYNNDANFNKENMLQILAEIGFTLGETIVSLRTRPPVEKRLTGDKRYTLHNVDASTTSHFQQVSARITKYVDVMLHTDSGSAGMHSCSYSPRLPFNNTTQDMLSRRFFGRLSYLQEMRRLLSKSIASQHFHLALHGLPGVGKTQLALRYIQEYRSEYDVIIWIAAATNQKIQESLARVAYELRLPGCGLEAPTQVRVQNILSWLNTAEYRCLIVFDNIDDVAILEPFKTSSEHSHIIITSRDPNSGVYPVEDGLLVKPFSLEESKNFFFQNLKIKRMEKLPPKLEGLFKEWDGLPMALDQMGSYINKEKLTLSAFAAMYENHRPKVHSMHKTYAREWGYNNTTATALSIRTLSENSRTLLHAMTFMDPDRIFDESSLYGNTDDQNVLLKVFEDQFYYFEAVEELVTRSLLQKDARGFRVHRLVQAVSFDDMDIDQQHAMFQRILRLISSACPQGIMGDWLNKAWDPFERYYLHVGYLLAHRNLIQQGDTELSKLVSTCTWYMFERGYFAEADRLLCNAIPLLEGKDAHSASLRYSLAGIRNECNRVMEARVLMDEVISTQEKILQPDHLALGNAYKSAGIIYMETGELGKAFDLLRKALRISGDTDKAQAAATHANLTHCYLRIKDIKMAVAHAEMGYKLSLEACGDKSDRFAEAVFDLANVRLVQNRHDDAFELHKKALEIRMIIMPTHDKTGHSYHKLGTLCERRGELENAFDHLEQAINIYGSNFDPVPRVARSKFKQSQILEKLGRPDAAAEARNMASIMRNSIKTFSVNTEQTEEAYDMLVCSWFR